MYLQVVFCLSSSNQSQAAIVDVKVKSGWDYFQVERKVRPQLSKVLGRRDYDILFMYEIPKDEYYRLVDTYYKP